ncbi:MAG TPA: SLBB domain-containing protein, partial [Polyangiaceae bacterium]|nr:SLBB domain-containing protein [Polyangiaceae bacterium]
AAYGLVAELARYVIDGDTRSTRVINLKLSDVLAGNAAADLPLQPYDTLVIKETPEWSQQATVRLQGEVRFPGDYPVRKGETLSSVIARAGGLTEHAFPDGAVFTREEIKAQEQQQIETLATRLQSDLAVVALQSTAGNAQRSPSDALAVGQNLLTQLRETKPVGRLVIHLSRALEKPNSDDDVQLRNNDVLIVPPLRQYVAVLGEVQSPTSHVWRRNLSRDDYLALSGGLTDKADKKRIYVVRADGSVVARQSGRWFSHADVEMRPGDSIVVPLDTQKMRPLPLWTAVTTIIYNLAVSVAAIGSL